MEVILMIGIPGSGKTTFANNEFPEHHRISRDDIDKYDNSKKSEILKLASDIPKHVVAPSRERKIEYLLIDDALKDNKNIVIDDTNVEKRIRRIHIRHAKKFNATIKGIFFENIGRAYIQNVKREKYPPTSALDSLRKKLEPPTYDEGFDYIQRIC